MVDERFTVGGGGSSEWEVNADGELVPIDSEPVNVQSIFGVADVIVREGDDIDQAFADLSQGETMAVAQPSTPYRNDGWLEPEVSDFTIVFQSRFAADGQAIVKAADGANAGGIRVGNAARRSGFEIRGLGFDGNDANQTTGTNLHGVHVVDAERFVVDNCYVTRTYPYHQHNTGGSGVRADPNTTNYTLSNIFCQDIGDRAVETAGTWFTVKNVYNLNGFDRTVSADLSNTAYGTVRNIQANGTQEGSVVGFSGGHHITIDGVLALDCNGSGVVLRDGDHFNVSNVMMIGGQEGVDIPGGATDVYVSSLFVHSPSDNMGHGFRVNDAGAENITLDGAWINGGFNGVTLTSAAGGIAVKNVTVDEAPGGVANGISIRTPATVKNVEVRNAGEFDINVASGVTGAVIEGYTGTGSINDDGTATAINGEAVESASAESPQQSYPTGTFVRFTDSGDGSGTGTYLVARDGSTIQVASSA